MKFTINNTEYMIQWRHWLPLSTPPLDPSNPDLKRSNVHPNKPNGGTDASLFILHKNGEKELVFKVQLTCFHKDQFSYEEGRTSTLTQLLNFKRTEIWQEVRVEVKMSDGRVFGQPLSLPTGTFNDDGLFNRADRTLIWGEYRLSKLPSEKDLKGEYERLVKKLQPDLERLAGLALHLGLMGSIDGDIEFIPDETEDDEPRQ